MFQQNRTVPNAASFAGVPYSVALLGLLSALLGVVALSGCGECALEVLDRLEVEFATDLSCGDLEVVVEDPGGEAGRYTIDTCLRRLKDAEPWYSLLDARCNGSCVYVLEADFVRAPTNVAITFTSDGTRFDAQDSPVLIRQGQLVACTDQESRTYSVEFNTAP